MRPRILPPIFAIVAAVAAPAGAGDPAGGYFATKADYRAGILTRGVAGSAPLDGSNDCTDPPVIPRLDLGENHSDSGTTVGKTNNVGSIPLACNGNYTTVAGPDAIYTFTTGHNPFPTFVVQTGDPSYDPSLYLLSVCDSGPSCVAGADNCFAQNAPGNPCGAVSDESFGPVPLAPFTQFFIYVDSFYAVGGVRSQGPYDLTVIGPTVSVELMDFTIH